MASDHLDEDKDFVLVENTAQAVFKYLDHLKDSRTTLGVRWIWELLQNARDAAGPQGVSLSIDVDDSSLIFRHTGRPFKNREIAHLIFHGSTKAKEEGDLGRFGSGFLSTHLLSPIVHVKGQLYSEGWFNFSIDRSGSDVDALRQGMEDSWIAFKNSLTQEPTLSGAFTTAFSYPLTFGVLALVNDGLAQLLSCAPFVLAFGAKIRTLSITRNGEPWTMSRVNANDGEQNLITIACSDDVLRHIAISGDESSAAALLLEQKSGSRHVTKNDGVPRFYIVFPLVSTERVPLPYAVHSIRFKPREDRDGIVMDAETDGGTANRELIDAIGTHCDTLLHRVADNQWRCDAELLRFNLSDMPDWAKEPWFVDFMRRRLDFARRTPILVTRSGNSVCPQDAWIPHAASEAGAARLGELLAGWQDAGQKLPVADSMAAWFKNVNSWAGLLAVNAETLPEAFTIGRLCRQVATMESVAGLAGRLPSTADPLAWLTALHGAMHQADAKLFETQSTLPSQSLVLKKRGELWLDDGIDEELKDISEEIGLSLRAVLLHKAAATNETAKLLKPKSEEAALNEILALFKRDCKAGRMPLPKVPACGRLLAWICRRPKYVDGLAGMPIATEDAQDDAVATLEVTRGTKQEDLPLGPYAQWPERFRRFAALFPKRKTMHKGLADTTNTDVWQFLATNGYIHLSPVLTVATRMDRFLPDEPLAEETGAKGHETVAEVEVTKIAWLDEKNIGAIDLARNSPARAAQLVELVVELTHGGDSKAFDVPEVLCQCGKSHRIYHAAWLVPLKDRKWIPLGSDGKRRSNVSAESLASLVKTSSQLVAGLQDSQGTQLLRALGVNPGDFALWVVSDTEEARVALIQSLTDLAQAAGGNAERLRDFANEVREHPDIIQEIENKKREREAVHRNQHIGKLVEQLLGQELTAQKGLSVEQRRVGADFEVDSDYTENGEEVLLELGSAETSTFIELKATRTDIAKMTPRQAENACELRQRFALCVVPVGEELPTREWVRDNALFFFDIGEHLIPAWFQFREIADATDRAKAFNGPVSIVMTEGQYRFGVARDIWSRGLNFKQAVERFLSGSATVAVARGGEQSPLRGSL